MFLTRSALIGLMTVMAIAMATSQESGAQSSIHSAMHHRAGGSVSPAAPVIRLTNVGHDSNVFNRNQNDHPQSDVTATLEPPLDARLRMAHARANGRTQFDGYYFRQLTDLRAIYITDTGTHRSAREPGNGVCDRIAHEHASSAESRKSISLARRRNDSVNRGNCTSD